MGSEQPSPITSSPAEFSFTFTPLPEESIAELIRRAAQRIAGANGSIAGMFVFADLKQQPAICSSFRKMFGEISWPILWAEGKACSETPLAGIQVFALAGIRLKRIVNHGQTIGTVYDHDGMRQCLLAGIGPNSISDTRSQQTEQTFANMALALQEAGFAMADIVRTWFYNDDILAWYPEFNSVRTRVYSRIQFRTGSAPASTGVAGHNPAGGALTSAVWAVQPLDAFVRTEEVASPLQCAAPLYGSSFSRATEISSSTGSRLFISGTASIAPAGETLWPGDTRRQIGQTMAVVEAILASRGFSFAELNRAVAYFKRRDDAPLFAEWCAAHGLLLPFVPLECDICRDDLLFELEADAFKLKQ